MQFKLVSKFSPSGDQPKAIKQLTQGIKRGFRFITLLGVTGSGKTYTISNVIKNINKPVLVISPNKILAAQLYREFKTFFPENAVNYFVSYYDYYQPEAYIPSTDTYISKEAMINQEIERLRHLATSSLMTRRDVIIVASVSCIYNLGLPSNYLNRALYLEKGKPITRGDLIKQLVRIQYKRNNLELQRGSFRVRGEIVEVMPPSEDVIYKIDLTDQKVNALLVLDKLKRSPIKELSQIVIFPAKHFVIYQDEIDRAIKDIKDELKERLNYFRKRKMFLEAERLERITKQDLAMIKVMGYCHGIENYSRHLTGAKKGDPPFCLLDYFPDDFLMIIDESHVTIPQIRAMYGGDYTRKKNLVEFGFRLPSAFDNRPLKFHEFENKIHTNRLVFISHTFLGKKIQQR